MSAYSSISGACGETLFSVFIISVCLISLRLIGIRFISIRLGKLCWINSWQRGAGS